MDTPRDRRRLAATNRRWPKASSSSPGSRAARTSRSPPAAPAPSIGSRASCPGYYLLVVRADRGRPDVARSTDQSRGQAARPDRARALDLRAARRRRHGRGRCRRPRNRSRALLTAPLPTAGLPMRVATLLGRQPARRARARDRLGRDRRGRDRGRGMAGRHARGRQATTRSSSNSAAPMKLAPASDRTPSPRLLLTSVVLEPGEYTLRLAAVDARRRSRQRAPHHRRATSRTRWRLRPGLGPDPQSDGRTPASAPRPMPSSVIYSETHGGDSRADRQRCAAAGRVARRRADCGIRERRRRWSPSPRRPLPRVAGAAQLRRRAQARRAAAGRVRRARGRDVPGPARRARHPLVPARAGRRRGRRLADRRCASRATTRRRRCRSRGSSRR